MSGFSNAVVGGIGKLVRKWIQSPDYVPTISGWTVNQDGSAEFNDVTIRGFVVISGGSGELLVYAGTPAAGNLILAVSSVPGVDQFGNAYTTGLSIATTTPTDGNRSGITFEQPAYGTSPYIKSIDQGVAVGSQLAILGANLDANRAPAEIYLAWGPAHGGSTDLLARADEIQFSKQGNTFGGMEFGSGPLGWYHYEEWDITNGYNIPNAAITQLSGAANFSLSELYTDYGAACFDPVSGVFTPPVPGLYQICVTVGYTTWVAGSRFFLTIRNVGKSYGGADFVCGAAGHAIGTAIVTSWISDIYPLNIAAYQNTGSARPIENSAIIRSFLSFRRLL